MNERLISYAASQIEKCIQNDTISNDLFRDYGVNRGLRDLNGKGVLTGLTTISKIVSFNEENGERFPCDGQLWYRGYRIEQLIDELGDGFGFEKTAYLLLFGERPTAEEEQYFPFERNIKRPKR